MLRPEVLDVPESPMVQIATAAERKPGSLKLCYGEADQPTPAFICDAATVAMGAGHTFYTHTAGYPALREAIAEKVFELHQVRYQPSNIMATVGATCAVFAAVRATVGTGDNAVIVTPAYALFANAVRMVGAEPREVALCLRGTHFQLDLDAVERAIDRHTRLLIVNSPSNPTGWVITTDEQRALMSLAERCDLMVLADEVYERLCYAPSPEPGRFVTPSFARCVDHRDRLIVVNSFSKTYNMTGWRLGWAQASEGTVRAMYAAAEFITSNPAAMVQQAGLVALRDGEPWLRERREEYARRRAQVLAAASQLAGVEALIPDGGFYAFLRIAGMTDSAAFVTRLLERTGLALAPGSAFGRAGEGFVRLCFAVSEEVLADALRRLGNFLAYLPPGAAGARLGSAP